MIVACSFEARLPASGLAADRVEQPELRPDAAKVPGVTCDNSLATLTRAEHDRNVDHVSMPRSPHPTCRPPSGGPIERKRSRRAESRATAQCGPVVR